MKRKAFLLLSIVAITCMTFAADKNPVVGGQPHVSQQEHRAQRGQLQPTTPRWWPPSRPLGWSTR